MSVATFPPEQRTSEQAVTGSTLRMSYEEWLHWAGEHIRSEWVNGEVIVFTPPKNAHQTLVTFLAQVIGLFVGGTETCVCYWVATYFKNSRTFSLVLKDALTESPFEKSTKISYFRNSPDPS